MLNLYAKFTLKEYLGRWRTATWLIDIVILAIAFLFGGAFWYLGDQIGNSLSILPIITFILLGYGMWLGLRHINAHRPNGYYFLDDMTWLLIQLGSGLATGLLVASLTVVSYYLSNVIKLDLPGMSVVAYVVSLYLLISAALLSGTLLATTIRVITANKFGRFALTIAVGYIALLFINYIANPLSVFEGSFLLSPEQKNILPLFIDSALLALIATLANYVVVSFIQVTETPANKYWPIASKVKYFSGNSSLVLQGIVSHLVFITRDAEVQRKLLYFLVMFLTFPYIAVYSGFTTGQQLVDLLMLYTFMLTIIFSIISGRQSFSEYLALKNYPKLSSLRPATALIGSLLVVLLLLLLLVNSSIAGLTLSDWLIIISFTSASHVVLFYSGYLGELAKRLPRVESSEGDKIVALGLASSIIIAIITFIIYGNISNYITIPLVIAWGAGALTFMFFASSHFRKEI